MVVPATLEGKAEGSFELGILRLDQHSNPISQKVDSANGCQRIKCRKHLLCEGTADCRQKKRGNGEGGRQRLPHQKKKTETERGESTGILEISLPHW